jgi:hypothetical protein
MGPHDEVDDDGVTDDGSEATAGGQGFETADDFDFLLRVEVGDEE